MKNILKIKLVLQALLLLIISGCSKSDENSLLPSDPFVVAFESLSARLSDINSQLDIPLVYSSSAPQNGVIRISINPINTAYGDDFTTVPNAQNNIIEVPIISGTVNSSFIFNLNNTTLDETSQIEFQIIEIDIPNSSIQGNTNFLISNSVSLGRAIMPQVGGPNEPNQVYIDLSTESSSPIVRDSWDLAFYGGDEFRVGINGSIYMAAGSTGLYNIDLINEADVTDLQPLVAVGTFDPLNIEYVDNPNGSIEGNSMGTVKINDSENPVYLINMGFEVGTETPGPGSTAITGNDRGWMKIRVLRRGNDYLLQYASLNSSSHEEVLIQKTSSFNFSFFSLANNTLVNVEPEIDKWDLNFTVFTNIIDGSGTYGFADGVLHNRKGGVLAYQVNTSEINYQDFNLSNVDSSRYEEDQRAIGANWRNVFEGTTLNDRFFILKDSNNNIYKIKFLAMLNDQGVRGFPEFEYQLIN